MGVIADVQRNKENERLANEYKAKQEAERRSMRDAELMQYAYTQANNDVRKAVENEVRRLTEVSQQPQQSMYDGLAGMYKV